jgi:hypothetical protein
MSVEGTYTPQPKEETRYSETWLPTVSLKMALVGGSCCPRSWEVGMVLARLDP